MQRPQALAGADRAVSQLAGDARFLLIDFCECVKFFVMAADTLEIAVDELACSPGAGSKAIGHHMDRRIRKRHGLILNGGHHLTPPACASQACTCATTAAPSPT